MPTWKSSFQNCSIWFGRILKCFTTYDTFCSNDRGVWGFYTTQYVEFLAFHPKFWGDMLPDNYLKITRVCLLNFHFIFLVVLAKHFSRLSPTFTFSTILQYFLFLLTQCFSNFVRPRPGKFFFFLIKRGPGPNKFTPNYLSNFFKFIH